MLGLFNYAKSRFEAKKAIEATLSDKIRVVYSRLL